MEIRNFKTSLVIPISYIHLQQQADVPVVILFHGYADSAKSFLKRALPEIPKGIEVLAINGPFPVPQRNGEEWKHAYAWYFSDPKTKTVLIPPSAAVQAVENLLAELNLTSRRKILVGFSQGGFFVPHLLSKLSNVEKTLIIGAAYRSHDYPESLLAPVDGLHGARDEVISAELATNSFRDFSGKNPKGELSVLEDMGHELNDSGRSWIMQKLNETAE